MGRALRNSTSLSTRKEARRNRLHHSICKSGISRVSIAAASVPSVLPERSPSSSREISSSYAAIDAPAALATSRHEGKGQRKHAEAALVVRRDGSVKASVRGLPIKRAERKAANFGIGEDLRIDRTVCVLERPEDQSVDLDLHGNVLCRFLDPNAGFSVLLLLAPMQPRRRPSRP